MGHLTQLPRSKSLCCVLVCALPSSVVATAQNTFETKVEKKSVLSFVDIPILRVWPCATGMLISEKTTLADAQLLVWSMLIYTTAA